MHKLGISVYPDKSPKEEVYAYMEKAAKLGIDKKQVKILLNPNLAAFSI